MLIKVRGRHLPSLIKQTWVVIQLGILGAYHAAGYCLKPAKGILNIELTFHLGTTWPPLPIHPTRSFAICWLCRDTSLVKISSKTDQWFKSYASRHFGGFLINVAKRGQAKEEKMFVTTTHHLSLFSVCSLLSIRYIVLSVYEINHTFVVVQPHYCGCV
jgi:hypothetical protein